MQILSPLNVIVLVDGLSTVPGKFTPSTHLYGNRFHNGDAGRVSAK